MRTRNYPGKKRYTKNGSHQRKSVESDKEEIIEENPKTLYLKSSQKSIITLPKEIKSYSAMKKHTRGKSYKLCRSPSDLFPKPLSLRKGINRFAISGHLKLTPQSNKGLKTSSSKNQLPALNQIQGILEHNKIQRQTLNIFFAHKRHNASKVTKKNNLIENKNKSYSVNSVSQLKKNRKDVRDYMLSESKNGWTSISPKKKQKKRKTIKNLIMGPRASMLHRMEDNRRRDTHQSGALIEVNWQKGTVETVNKIERLVALPRLWRPTGALPPARYHASAAYGDESGVLILGGMHNDTKESVWKFARKWKELEVDIALYLRRYGHTSVVYDNKCYIFGGVKKEITQFEQNNTLNDIISFDLSKLEINVSRPQSIRPEGRRHHTCYLVGNDMLIHGGLGPGGKALKDLWAYSIIRENWRKMDDVSDSGDALSLYGHCMVFVHNNGDVYQSVNRLIDRKSNLEKKKKLNLNGLLIFGGFGPDFSPRGELFHLSFEGNKFYSVSKLLTRGKQPEPRGFHIMEFLEEKGMIVMHGGINNICYREKGDFSLNELWVLDLLSRTWSKVRESILHTYRLPWRHGHCSWVANEKVFFFGGFGRDCDLNSDVWELDYNVQDFRKKLKVKNVTDDSKEEKEEIQVEELMKEVNTKESQVKNVYSYFPLPISKEKKVMNLLKAILQ